MHVCVCLFVCGMKMCIINKYFKNIKNVMLQLVLAIIGPPDHLIKVAIDRTNGPLSLESHC